MVSACFVHRKCHIQSLLPLGKVGKFQRIGEPLSVIVDRAELDSPVGSLGVKQLPVLQSFRERPGGLACYGKHETLASINGQRAQLSWVGDSRTAECTWSRIVRSAVAE